ncbi:peptide deformylase, partial [Treponema sp. R6D11]
DPREEKTKEILKDLYDTCCEYEGAGLAAVQVGLLKRLAIATDGERVIELINPKIVKAKGVQDGPEGCLSVPDTVGLVERPEWIMVETDTTAGGKARHEAEGLLARAICHEMDHMDGILFTSKAREIKKEVE